MSLEPTREEIDAMQGITVLEFGTGWCGYCQAAQPLIADALAGRSDVTHFVIEDGRGKRLGRSYGVKLWPTLIVLQDGHEVARVVRPVAAVQLRAALDQAGNRSSISARS